MEYVCTAGALADYAVAMCSHEGEPISNLQVQKILYMIQCVYCRATDGNLAFEDQFQAWPYGPVLPGVYEDYAPNGGRAIHIDEDPFIDVDDDVKAFFDEGIRILRNKSPWDLVAWSHAEGSPWDVTWKEGQGYKKNIDNQLIIDAALAEDIL